MNDEEIKALEKEVKKLKRKATEWAGQLHDLVEERLPDAYTELPELSEATLHACMDWAAARDRLQAARAEQGG